MTGPFDDLDVPSNVPALRAALRIRGESLDRDFITQQLGVSPNEHSAHARSWVYRLAARPDTELGDLLDRLIASFPQDAVLWGELASTYSVDVFVTVSIEGETQGTVVDAPVLERLGRLGFPLIFDFHAPAFGDAGGEEG
jgi:hypothetical protein